MTCSQLNCLLELYRLSLVKKEVASVTLTKGLGLSKPSVHRLLEGLRGMDLVEKEYYGAACLTPKGESLAKDMLAKAEALSDRLKGTVSPDKAYFAALTLLSAIPSNEFECFPDTDD